MEVWNLYAQFQSAHNLLSSQPFCAMLQRFTSYCLQQSRPVKELEYFIRYGEELNPEEQSDNQKWMSSTMFRYNCTSPRVIVFSNGQENLSTNEGCILVRLHADILYSLLVRSKHPTDIVTMDLRPIVPYYQNNSFWLFFI